MGGYAFNHLDVGKCYLLCEKVPFLVIPLFDGIQKREK